MAWMGILGISVATVLIITLAAFTIQPLPVAHAQSDPFIGQVSIFAGNFAPRGWALCDGQLIRISDNEGLFSILGTTYGGDGRTDFALPDMRGRSWVHAGTGPGLDPVRLGERGGSLTTTLVVNNLPSHSHTLNAVEANGDSASADGTALALSFARLYSTQSPVTTMHSGSIGDTGSGAAFNIEDPYVSMNCIIALVGVFPSRN